MKLTVEDVYHFPELSKMTLIAGKGGLKNEIRHCGILDYEYDEDVASKYQDYNFKMDGGFLTLTSFLYAKNDPKLIYDAVKRLTAKNGCGLIIKNIFRLPISDTVIRYADRMEYPIFVLNDSYPFFEDIIVLIEKKKEQYESFYYREQKMERLLQESDASAACALLMRDIHPALQDDLIAVCVRKPDSSLSPEEYLREENRLYEAGCIGHGDIVFYYRGGLLLICSAHRHASENPQEIAHPYLKVLQEEGCAAPPGAETDGLESGRIAPLRRFSAGVSRLHHIREELKEAVEESLYAVRFDEGKNGSCTTFDSLGVYQAILPYVEENSMKGYCRRYIAPLAEYDSERNGEILGTVITFIQCGGDLDQAAGRLSQHRNTIRYRLRRAGELLSLNPFELGDYERLALAVRIHICAQKEKRR